MLQLLWPLTCPARSWVTLGILLEELSRNSGTQESAVVYRWGLWAPKHLTLHKSKITGQLQHYPDVSLYHNKNQLKTAQRTKPQIHLLSRGRKQCRQHCSKSTNSTPAQAQVNQHSILGKCIPFPGWIWSLNTIWIHCTVRETFNYTIFSFRQKSRWCL